MKINFPPYVFILIIGDWIFFKYFSNSGALERRCGLTVLQLTDFVIQRSNFPQFNFSSGRNFKTNDEHFYN